MVKFVVELDENGLPKLNEDGDPELVEVDDDTPIKLVNGYDAALDPAEIAEIEARKAARALRNARSKAERIEQDLLPKSPLESDPLFRAVILELLQLIPLQNRPTASEFRDKVRDRLVADPDI